MSDAAIYEIRVRGHLPDQWADWFGLRVENQSNGDAVLTGEVRDQAALHAVLRQIYNLGLTLIAVNRVECEERKDVRNETEQTTTKRCARER